MTAEWLNLKGPALREWKDRFGADAALGQYLEWLRSVERQCHVPESPPTPYGTQVISHASIATSTTDSDTKQGDALRMMKDTFNLPTGVASNISALVAGFRVPDGTTAVGDDPAESNKNSDTRHRPADAPSPPAASGDGQKLQLFSGGTVVFYDDWVELSGVDICSGPRSQSKRNVLNLLSRRNSDGIFEAYGGVKLAKLAELEGGVKAVAGLIRDLRRNVADALREGANIECGNDAVILSGGRGYRFAPSITVRDENEPHQAAIGQTEDKADVPNVADDDVRDVFDVLDDATARPDWILQQLANGVKLKAPAVAKQFKCSVKTAQRDLTALKDEGEIEYVGAPRTGHYRLCQAPPSAP